MRTTGIVRWVCMLVILFCSITVSAQMSGDKLFLEGQKLQQRMTVNAQTSAIKKFRAAKVVYNTTDKKTMCDNQITICRKNLATLKKTRARRGRKTVGKSGSVKKHTKIVEEDSVAEKNPQIVNVELSLSESRLDFKSNPKKGAVQIVDVTCNMDEIELSSKPDWVIVDVAKKKLFVSVQENKTSDERSGVVRVKCYDKETDLVVNQAKPSALKSLGKLFKKKK